MASYILVACSIVEVYTYQVTIEKSNAVHFSVVNVRVIQLQNLDSIFCTDIIVCPTIGW